MLYILKGAVSIAAAMTSLFVYSPALAELSEGRAITTVDLLAVRDIRAMAVSPDGSHVAYQLRQADADRNSYDTFWYVAAVEPDATPAMVADNVDEELAVFSTGQRNGEFVNGDVVWSHDGQWIVYTAMRDGEVQLWRSHIAQYGSEPVTQNAADVQDPRFSNDGRTLFFAVGRTREAIRELNQAQSRRGYLAQVPRIYDVEQGPMLPPCRDNNERAVRPNANTWDCQLEIWAVDWPTGAERLASPEEVTAYFANPNLSASAQFRRGSLRDQDRNMEAIAPDGLRSAWFENEDSDTFQGLRPPMRLTFFDGDATIRCSLDECRSSRPTNIWWSEDGSEIFFLIRSGYNETLNAVYGWTPASEEIRTIVRGDDQLYDCEHAADLLICGHESWTSPRKIVSVNLYDGHMTTIVDPNPEFRNLSFTRIDKIEATDAYDNQTHAHLVYPDGYEEGQRYPLIIVQYRSRGFLRGGVGDEQPIHVLAQNDFFVLSVDMPEGDYVALESDWLALNIAFSRLMLVELGPVTAIESMVDDLIRRGMIDPDLIGMSGVSAGAIITDLALLRRNYAAASTAYSIATTSDFDFDPSSFVIRTREEIFGEVYSEQEPALRASRSIHRNANRINTPYLIQVADREYYVTRQNYHALRGAGKPVELHIFPNEYHVKWQPAHRLTVYNRNVDWFNFWLRGVEDPDPAKAEQYERWRALRELHEANLAELADEEAAAAAEAQRQAELADIVETVGELAGDTPTEAE